MFCCLRPIYPSNDKNDAQARCYEQDSLMLALRRQSTWYTDAAAECDNLTRRSSSHRSQTQILVENRDFCPSLGGPRWNIAITLGTEKLEWCGYLTVKKFWRYVYLFRQSPRMWRTDTAWRHKPRLCIASRGKKRRQRLLSSTHFDHRSLCTTLHDSWRFTDALRFDVTVWRKREADAWCEIVDSILDTTLHQSSFPKHWSKITIFAPVRESRRNVAITFCMEKLEWCLPHGETRSSAVTERPRDASCHWIFC